MLTHNTRMHLHTFQENTQESFSKQVDLRKNMTIIKCWRIFLFTTLLSILFFYNKEVSFEDYILVAYLILAFLLLSYRFFCCNKILI